MPRISLSSQLSIADLAIICLFIFGGLAGFPGFVKYADIKTQIATLSYKPLWASLFFVFNFLLIYRKIGKCYFSRWLPIFHTFLITAGMTMVFVLITKYSVLSSMSLLDALVAVQAALAAVLLIVQGWVDFKPDIKSLAALSRKIDARVRNLIIRSDKPVESGDVKRISDLCAKFVLDIDAALAEGWRDEAGQSELRAEKTRVEQITDTLKAPLSDVREALQRLRKAQ
jgi:hypothetical protein